MESIWIFCAVLSAALVGAGIVLMATRQAAGGSGGGNNAPTPEPSWADTVLQRIGDVNSRVAAATVTPSCVSVRMAGTKEELEVATQALNVEQGSASVSLPGCTRVTREAGQPAAPAPPVVKKVGRKRLEEAVTRALAAQQTTPPAAPSGLGELILAAAAEMARAKKAPVPPSKEQVIPADDPPNV